MCRARGQVGRANGGCRGGGRRKNETHPRGVLAQCNCSCRGPKGDTVARPCRILWLSPYILGLGCLGKIGAQAGGGREMAPGARGCHQGSVTAAEGGTRRQSLCMIPLKSDLVTGAGLGDCLAIISEMFKILKKK